MLANGLIEYWRIKSRNEFIEYGDFEAYVPEVKLRHKPEVNYISLDVSDDDLMRISKEHVLSMDLKEMKAIQAHYRKPEVIAERKELGLSENPTDAEIEVLAQTWSEHCKHKIFNAKITYKDESTGKTKEINSLFDTYIKRATEESKKPWLVSVFRDNAGVIKLDDEYNLVMKVETHNTPSALDPYGGAITGIVGVNRDPLGTGMGARLIFNTDIFCFGVPDYQGPIPSRILHPKRVFEGVRRGVEHGGNKSGIPTINGTVVFDSYKFGTVTEILNNTETIMGNLAKPLVFCGTAGIMPACINGEPSHGKKINPSDLIVMAGGRVGKDGIHGATFSSIVLDETSPSTAVQIGDPITQKKMADFLLEARDKGLYNSITDNGAGGLSCSIGEEATLCGGAEVNLEKVPLKYAGLQPWEILLSEAQERMTLAVPPEKIGDFLELAKQRDVEATVIGNYTDSGKFKATYRTKSGEEMIATYLDMKFLHKGVPEKEMNAVLRIKHRKEPKIPEPENFEDVLLKMLGRWNICSKEYVVRQYDHEVQAGTIVKPLTGEMNDGPSDAAVYWPIEMQRKGSRVGVVVSNGINQNYMLIDGYHGTASAIDEAVRNYVSVGGNPDRMAGLDNFCWSKPYDEEHLAKLVQANMALYDYSVGYDMPWISGKDSMHNEYAGELGNKHIDVAVIPTVVITAIGRIDDTRKAATMDVKHPNDKIYVLGESNNELGGSEYYAMAGEKSGEAFIGNSVPKVDAKSAKQRCFDIYHAMQEGLVASCHDCSNGGLIVALAETLFSGGYGGKIDLGEVPKGRKVDRDDTLAFTESNSRYVVTVPANKAAAFERYIGGTCAEIGTVSREKNMEAYGLDGRRLISAPIGKLKQAWQAPMKW